MNYNHVQMVFDNYNILHNEEIRKRYPNLYQEVYNHDKITMSSWYDLSDSAYDEYKKWCNDKEC